MLVELTETYCNKVNVQITQRDDFIQISYANWFQQQFSDYAVFDARLINLTATDYVVNRILTKGYHKGEVNRIYLSSGTLHTVS